MTHSDTGVVALAESPGAGGVAEQPAARGTRRREPEAQGADSTGGARRRQRLQALRDLRQPCCLLILQNILSTYHQAITVVPVAQIISDLADLIGFRADAPLCGDLDSLGGKLELTPSRKPERCFPHTLSSLAPAQASQRLLPCQCGQLGAPHRDPHLDAPIAQRPSEHYESRKGCCRRAAPCP